MPPNETGPANAAPAPPRRFGCLHLLLAAIVAMVLTAVFCFFAYRFLLRPEPFTPVRLNAQEEQILQGKLDQIGAGLASAASSSEVPAAGGALEPEAYSETGADRTIRFTERELNALLANNTDLADRLVFDLSKDLVSAKLLMPLDEDVPVLGGKTLRVKVGATFRQAGGKPEVILRGVMVMGVPLPNAWLGGLKNIDVVREFGGEEGVWSLLAAGIESLSVEDGALAITLKE